MEQTTIVHIPFNGQTVDATAIDDDDYLVALKPICENIGLSYSAQHERLNRQPWAVIRITRTTGSDGKSYEMTMLDRQTFVMWLATIDTSRLKSDAAREVVTAYQRECAKVLDAHFFGSQPKEDALTMARGLIAAKDMLDAARAEIEAMRPKALLGESMSEANGSMSVTKATRHVAAMYPWVTREWVFDTLRRCNLVCKADTSPTRHGIETGRVRAITSTYRDGDGVEQQGRQYAHVTPKGIEWLLSCARAEGEVA